MGTAPLRLNRDSAGEIIAAAITVTRFAPIPAFTSCGPHGLAASAFQSDRIPVGTPVRTSRRQHARNHGVVVEPEVRVMLVGTTVACLAAACSPTPSAPTASATSVSSATLAANGEGAANKPGRTSRRGAELPHAEQRPRDRLQPAELATADRRHPARTAALGSACNGDAETVEERRFEANVLLIRPEIYEGQRCESTDLPYIFVGVLGYFECAHTVDSHDGLENLSRPADNHTLSGPVSAVTPPTSDSDAGLLRYASARGVGRSHVGPVPDRPGAR